MGHTRIEITPLFNEMAMARFEDNEEVILRVEIHHSPTAGQLHPVGSCKVSVKPGTIHYEDFSEQFIRLHDEVGHDTPLAKALDRAVRNYVNGWQRKTSYTWREDEEL